MRRLFLLGFRKNQVLFAVCFLILFAFFFSVTYVVTPVYSGKRMLPEFNSLLCILSPPFLLFLPHSPPSFLSPPLHPPPAFPSSSAGASKGGDEPGKLPEQEEEEESQVLHGTGHCKWFNVRMGFGFISMSNREGSPLESPVDVFVHQVRPVFVFHLSLAHLIELSGTLVSCEEK